MSVFTTYVVMQLNTVVLGLVVSTLLTATFGFIFMASAAGDNDEDAMAYRRIGRRLLTLALALGVLAIFTPSTKTAEAIAKQAHQHHCQPANKP